MDDFFGGVFDFDMDGKTDDFERALGLLMILEDEERISRELQFDEPESEDFFDDFI